MSTSKSNPNMAIRFTGRNGKSRLIEALLRQPLVNNDKTLARKISGKVELIDLKPNKTLTYQGGIDTDLYFILNGNVSIRVNDREIATRSVNEHLGEMSMMDSTARRSASIVTNEACTFAKLKDTQFTKLANDNPQLWQYLAVSLANRLRERNKFHTAPRSQPVVFIGSSSEGLEIATSINKYLFKLSIVPRLWTEGVFEASKSTIEDLMKLISETDFAIIILTPDDITKSKTKSKVSPRDNVIFELGLFMGGLTRERTFFVCPKDIDIKIPTDLLGVTRLQYQHIGKQTLSFRLSYVKKQLTNLILKYGPK